MSIQELIKKISSNPMCFVKESIGLPQLEEGVELPKDILEFYKLCGGIDLFTASCYGFSIVSPNEFVLANPIIIGEICSDDISSEWYIIAKDVENNYITVDLNQLRLGRCYDSFWDRHGVVGECAIIATSFTELLKNLYLTNGKSIYWLDEGFKVIGDAYENISVS